MAYEPLFSLWDNLMIDMAVNKCMRRMRKEEQRMKKKPSTNTGSNKSAQEKAEAVTPPPVPNTNTLEDTVPQENTNSPSYKLIATDLIERARPFVTRDKLFEEYEEEYWTIYQGFNEMIQNGYMGDREFDDMYKSLRAVMKDG